MQIQISWLLKKPTDLDLHCLQRQVISGLSRTRVKHFVHYHSFPETTVWIFLKLAWDVPIRASLCLNKNGSGPSNMAVIDPLPTFDFVCYYIDRSQELHFEC